MKFFSRGGFKIKNIFMFKILVPLSKGFDVEELIKLGADEFYF
jgi:hypothetical protein